MLPSPGFLQHVLAHPEPALGLLEAVHAVLAMQRHAIEDRSQLTGAQRLFVRYQGRDGLVRMFHGRIQRPIRQMVTSHLRAGQFGDDFPTRRNLSGHSFMPGCPFPFGSFHS